ncbi:MAG: ribbon-helix-helix protein, CopG family [Agrobacterium cavarae]
MQQKSHPVSFRLPTDIKEALEKAAKDDVRSVSSLMEKIVTNWLKDQGYLDNPKD